MTKKLNTYTDLFAKNETPEQYLNYCYSEGAAPEPQDILNAWFDAEVAGDTMQAVIGAALVVDIDAVRQAGLAIAKDHGVSSKATKAFRRAVGNAGRFVAKLGYQQDGVNLEKLTITYKQDGKRVQACNVETAGKARGRGARPGGNEKAAPEQPQQIKLTPRQMLAEIVKQVGSGQVQDWLDEMTADAAATAEAARQIPGKPLSETRH